MMFSSVLLLVLGCLFLGTLMAWIQTRANSKNIKQQTEAIFQERLQHKDQQLQTLQTTLTEKEVSLRPRSCRRDPMPLRSQGRCFFAGQFIPAII